MTFSELASSQPARLFAAAGQLEADCCANREGIRPELYTICRVALGVLATYIAPMACMVAFGGGVVMMVTYSISVLKQKEGMVERGNSKPVCAQGYMEMLSGIRFSASANLVATTAFIAMHIAHTPAFFVPFTGFFLGIWVGHEGMRKWAWLK